MVTYLYNESRVVFWLLLLLFVVVVVVLFFCKSNHIIHLSNHTKVPFQNALSYQMVSINIDKLKKVFEQSL